VILLPVDHDRDAETTKRSARGAEIEAHDLMAGVEESIHLGEVDPDE
jgi:hypothetical protein